MRSCERGHSSGNLITHKMWNFPTVADSFSTQHDYSFKGMRKNLPHPQDWELTLLVNYCCPQGAIMQPWEKSSPLWSFLSLAKGEEITPGWPLNHKIFHCRNFNINFYPIKVKRHHLSSIDNIFMGVRKLFRKIRKIFTTQWTFNG